MTMLRDELTKLITDWPIYQDHPVYADTKVDDLVDAIMKLVEKYTTDATDPGEYKKTCAYCNRPAHHTYG